MKLTSPTFVALLLTLSSTVTASVVFSLSSAPNGQGTRRSWVVNRWSCTDLVLEGFDKQASWAFVDAGLAKGCVLYANTNCTGENVYIEKNNSDVLGPGAVNLVDVGFDKVASGFSCL